MSWEKHAMDGLGGGIWKFLETWGILTSQLVWAWQNATDLSLVTQCGWAVTA